MKKLTSAAFLLFVTITGCAFDESAVRRTPHDNAAEAIDDVIDLDDDSLSMTGLQRPNAKTCTPNAFVGCTSDGAAAYCGDDGRSLVVEDCELGCGETACFIDEGAHTASGVHLTTN